MGVLALYDITGIQDFIFSSQKLAENLGASVLVAQVLEEHLPQAIKEMCNSHFIENWKQSQEFSFLSGSIQAEIIYIGGGNALVAYKDRDLAIGITQLLSQKVLETSGNLKFSVAYRDTKFQNFQEDWKYLCHTIAENKQTTIHTSPLLGISITKRGITDGYPACEIDKGVAISRVASLKRTKSSNSSAYFDFLLGDDSINYVFPKEIDDLGQVQGNDHIALVHIDGNNMSSLIQKIVKNSSNYLEAVTFFRSISTNITRIYQETFRKVIRNLLKLTQNELFQKTFQLKQNNNKTYLPIRPIVLNGDEITWVCDGRLGISLAEIFLKLIHKTSIQLVNKKESISACAGVAIVPSSFPFYRAYEMAGDLCASAKKKGKVIAEIEKEQMGSWLDFHINYEGITSDLGEVRNRNYNIPSLSKPNPLKKNSISYQPQNLLWRPWCITGECEAKYQWKSLKEIFREFQDWPRNRLKNLRNTFLGGTGLTLLVQEYHSRGKSLPLFVDRQEEFPENNMTPYFDALELLDFFVEIPEEE